MAKEIFDWTEKYPPSVDDLIIPERIKKIVDSIIKTNNVPDMIFAGTHGTGKTSTARAIAKAVDAHLLYINASNDRNIDTVRNTIEPFVTSKSLDGKRKIVLLDEADWLNDDSAQPALRGIMGRCNKNSSFIFTCNYFRKIMPELKSRLPALDFNPTKEERWDLILRATKRFYDILKLEGVTEIDKAALAKHIANNHPDLRHALKTLQIHVQSEGSVTDKILSTKCYEIKSVASMIADKNFTALYQWALSINVNREIFFDLFDDLYSKKMIKPSSVPQALHIFHNYDYRSKIVSNFPMCLVACLMEIGEICEFVGE